jgi:outer membrane protein insertion porin family
MLLIGTALDLWPQRRRSPRRSRACRRARRRTGCAAPARAADAGDPFDQRDRQSAARTRNRNLLPAASAGEPYNNERLDEALKTLLATELFADVTIAGADTGNIVIQVRENPGHQPHRARRAISG